MQQSLLVCVNRNVIMYSVRYEILEAGQKEEVDRYWIWERIINSCWTVLLDIRWIDSISINFCYKIKLEEQAGQWHLCPVFELWNLRAIRAKPPNYLVKIRRTVLFSANCLW